MTEALLRFIHQCALKRIKRFKKSAVDRHKFYCGCWLFLFWFWVVGPTRRPTWCCAENDLKKKYDACVVFVAIFWAPKMHNQVKGRWEILLIFNSVLQGKMHLEIVTFMVKVDNPSNWCTSFYDPEKGHFLMEAEIRNRRKTSKKVHWRIGKTSVSISIYNRP